MGKTHPEGVVEAALEAWQDERWGDAARLSYAAFAQGAPMWLVHVLLHALLRSGDEAGARSLAADATSAFEGWHAALWRRSQGEISGAALMEQAERDPRRLADAWIVHGERLITEGKAELGALALRAVRHVSPLAQS